MGYYYFKEHLYQILSSYTFKCQSYESMPLLSWQQDFHSNKYYSELLFPQGTSITRYEVCKPSNSKAKQYVSVIMVTKCPWQQVRALTAVASVDLCYKYEVHLPSNSKNISICPCYHGNKVSIPTSHMMNICCFKGYVYQLRTSYTIKQRSYKHTPLLPW